jgi:hypothetical protein
MPGQSFLPATARVGVAGFEPMTPSSRTILNWVNGFQRPSTSVDGYRRKSVSEVQYRYEKRAKPPTINRTKSVPARRVVILAVAGSSPVSQPDGKHRPPANTRVGRCSFYGPCNEPSNSGPRPGIKWSRGRAISCANLRQHEASTDMPSKPVDSMVAVLAPAGPPSLTRATLRNAIAEALWFHVSANELAGVCREFRAAISVSRRRRPDVEQAQLRQTPSARCPSRRPDLARAQLLSRNCCKAVQSSTRPSTYPPRSAQRHPFFWLPYEVSAVPFASLGYSKAR